LLIFLIVKIFLYYFKFNCFGCNFCKGFLFCTLLKIYDLFARFVVKKIHKIFLQNFPRIYLLYDFFLPILISSKFHNFFYIYYEFCYKFISANNILNNFKISQENIIKISNFLQILLNLFLSNFDIKVIEKFVYFINFFIQNLNSQQFCIFS